MKNKRYFIINRNRQDIQKKYPNFKYYVMKNRKIFESIKDTPILLGPMDVDENWLFSNEAEEISEKEIVLMYH